MFKDEDVHTGADGLSLGVKANCAGYPVDHFMLEYSQRGGKTEYTKLPKQVRDTISQRYGDPSRDDDQAPLAVYYTTDRAGYRYPKALPTAVEAHKQKAKQQQAMANNGALWNRTVDYKDLMHRFRVAISQSRGDSVDNPAFIGQRAIDAINRAISFFLEGFSGITVEEKPPTLFINKAAGIEGINQSERLEIRQLSDGERSLIAMICDLGRRLALANPDLENPLEGAGVVLIDELELHLHPKWQREVVNKLRTTFPNIQFIATTHSPFIIQSVMPGELINLDPDEFPDEYSDKSIEDIAENVMGVEMPQKSQRYQDMMAAAEDYFALLRRNPAPTDEELKEAEQRLNEAAIPFSDDPAFHAYLKLERVRFNEQRDSE